MDPLALTQGLGRAAHLQEPIDNVRAILIDDHLGSKEPHFEGPIAP
jgi:hypothetical protein